MTKIPPRFRPSPVRRSATMISLVLLAGLVAASGVQAQSPSIFISPQQQQTIDQQRKIYNPNALKAPEDGADVRAPALNSRIRVSAIMTINGEAIAVINGRAYRERRAHHGIHVHRITEQHVTLTLLDTEQWGRARVGVEYLRQDWPNPPSSSIKGVRKNTE